MYLLISNNIEVESMGSWTYVVIIDEKIVKRFDSEGWGGVSR